MTVWSRVIPPPRSMSRNNLLVAAWITLTANVTFFTTLFHLTPYHGPAVFFFLLSSVILVFAYIFVVLQLVTWPWMARLMQSFFLLASSLTSYFVVNFGIHFDQGQIQNLMETDWREAIDLMTVKYFVWNGFLGIAPIIWLWWKPQAVQKLGRLLLDKVIALVLGLTLIVGAAVLYYVDYAAIFRENRALKQILVPSNSIGSLIGYINRQKKRENKPVQPWGTDAKATGRFAKPPLLVLVVGETARAESFGIDGYARDTTPELAQLPIINFNQTSSCGTATAVSLPCMFSGMTRKDYDPDTAATRQGLLDIIQRAGYQVTWLDNNSGCKGTCDRVTLLQPTPEQRKQWCNDEVCQDGMLVDVLDQQLKTQPVVPRVLVLHQMGSHGPAYFERYPPEFSTFKPICATKEIQGCSRQALINTYDNSIRYTDHVMASLIRRLQQENRYSSVFWYLSDHGESTGEKGLYLHGAPYLFAPSQQTHVPMLGWISPDYQAAQPERVACLSRRASGETSHDNLFPTLLGLLQVQTSVKVPELDLSECATTTP